MLVHPHQPPPTLSEAISEIERASDTFRRCWLSGDETGASAASVVALKCVDHVHGTLLRYRDDRKRDTQWHQSAFRAALQAPVGALVEPVDASTSALFRQQPPGRGALPQGIHHAALPLEAALQKLKHHTTLHGNFAVTAAGAHLLFVLTNGGNGRPDALCQIDVLALCAACRAAKLAL